jgi:hypothetical protein
MSLIWPPAESSPAFRKTRKASLEAIVENTPPSEDGEALRKNSSTPSQARSPNSERNWFAVYTTCRHEKRVARNLEQRQIEHFLPIYHTQHTWKDGTRVMLDLPLFPGYVFVHIDLHDRVGVLEVPGVVSMIERRSNQRRCQIWKWKHCVPASIRPRQNRTRCSRSDRESESREARSPEWKELLFARKAGYRWC